MADRVNHLVPVLNAEVLAIGDGPQGWTGERGYLWHSGAWPRSGKDRWLLMEGEDVLNPPKSTTCNDQQGPFSLADATKTISLLESAGLRDVSVTRQEGEWTADSESAPDSIARVLSVGPGRPRAPVPPRSSASRTPASS